MTRALLASAVVMDAAGWMCTAQGAYGLARMCFSAAVPFIAAWVLASLRGLTAGPPPSRHGFRTAPIPRGPWRDGAGLPTSGP